MIGTYNNKSRAMQPNCKYRNARKRCLHRAIVRLQVADKATKTNRCTHNKRFPARQQERDAHKYNSRNMEPGL